MATIQEFTQVSTQLLAITSKMMTFKDDWVNLSDDYQGEVTVLNGRLQAYQDAINQHGELDKTVMEILNNAVRSLQTAEVRLDGLRRFASSDHHCSPIRWWWGKLIFVLFPENIEKMVMKVNADLENIPKVLKEKGELSTQLREDDRRRPVPRLLINNNLYVPIEKAQQAVMAAIEDPDSHQFVLLHGGVGKGKSTLARYLLHYYGQENNNANTQGRDNRNLFEHIIWVSCAGSSKDDIATKQFTILIEHSPNILGDSPPTDSSGPKRIAKALRDFLSPKKVLMILDDVTDAGFLYAMWVSISTARQVKYLVTSQWSNICDNFRRDSSIIPMGDPTDTEAMHILASLVGLEAIPENLEVIAKSILRETENNPLALACLARHFAYSTEKTNKRAWQEAYAHLSELLQNTEWKIVLDSTPRSLWAAMKLCLDSLETPDARKILFLMYACKGEAVLEAVLRILHARINTSSCTFFQSSNELAMRELLKSTVQLKGEGQDHDEGSKVWAIKSLVKHYIMVSMKEEVSLVIGELIGARTGGKELPIKSNVDYKHGHHAEPIDKEKAAVGIILCGLYFDRSHRDIYEMVTKAITQMSIDCSNDIFNDLSRQAIEPIINLLDKPADEHWQESHVSCARQVFLTYICKRQLDHNNISQLLKLDACLEAQLATLTALSQICYTEERPLFKENNLNFLPHILHLTDSYQRLPPSAQKAPFQTLRAVCWKAVEENSTPLLVDSSTVLEVLVSSLVVANKRQGPTVEWAMAALASLAVSRDSSILWKIANIDGVLGGLVQLLSAHDMPSVQKEVARAMCNLASDQSLVRRIANQEGALAGLVECLAANEHPDVQENGAWALANLANSEESSIKWSIANQEKGLVNLVQLLSAHNRPSVQKQAARALRNLAGTSDESLKRRIANQEGALAGLVECLAANDHSYVQENGARALANLAASGESSIEWSIANEERVLVSLVQLLSAHDRPSVQEQAIRALRNLAGTSDESLKQRIANQEGALAGLVECLGANDHPDVQENGAWALANLVASGESSIEWSIANQERALASLVQLLSTHDRPRVQEQAARALGHLAATSDESLKRRIANQEGTLAGLVECLATNEHPDVQEKGAWALAKLANSEKSSIEWSIANQERALVNLVQLLSAHDRPSVQNQAAHALGHLAATSDESLKRRIANQEGTLAGLVECLAANEHPDVQIYGAWALANLAASRESSIKWSIANQERALVSLVQLLSAQDMPSTQEQAAHALGHLAATSDESLKRRIANHEGVVIVLVECLAGKNQPALQEMAALALKFLATVEEANTLFKGTEGLLKGLTSLLEAGIPPNTQSVGAGALTLINSTLGKDASLATAEAYVGRAEALNYLAMHAEALTDLDKAVELENGARRYTLSERCFTRTKIGDFDGALEDANQALNVSNKDEADFCLQERGILKRIMGDLVGALADLNEALKAEDDYEMLKHRGFVKFLGKDEEGSRADAELAMRIKPSRVDLHGYDRESFLGAIPVEYLGYKLK